MVLVNVWKSIIPYSARKAGMCWCITWSSATTLKIHWYVYSEIPLRKNLFPTETIQLICNANQLTVFYMKQGFSNICFWNDCSLKPPSVVEKYQMNYLRQVCFWKSHLIYVLNSNWKSASWKLLLCY